MAHENWERYMREWQKYIPNISDIMGLMKKSTAGTYGTYGYHKGRAFTGLPTSGAYGRTVAEPMARRASTLAGTEAGLRESDRGLRWDMIRTAEAKEASKKAEKSAGLKSIGKFGGTLAGAGIGALLGNPLIGASIGSMAMGGGGGGTSLLPFLMQQGQGQGQGYGGLLEMLIKRLMESGMMPPIQTEGNVRA